MYSTGVRPKELRSPTAYFPTPITPVRAHLVTKGERRAREREAGRVVVDERDLVMDERDMWGYAWDED